MPQRQCQMDRQTDDILWHNRALRIAELYFSTPLNDVCEGQSHGDGLTVYGIPYYGS